MDVAMRLGALATGACCKICGRSGALLCASCARAAPGPDGGTAIAGVDRAIVAWSYEGVVRSLVLDLKLRAVRGAAVPLAVGIVDLARRQGLRAGTITWVPGDRRENRVRGFDHAGLIARHVARALGLPLVPLLAKRSGTVDQTTLSGAARRSNLRGVFRADPCRGVVGLIDDVVTTGATAGSCAQALRRAGCSGVELLAACRA